MTSLVLFVVMIAAIIGGYSFFRQLDRDGQRSFEEKDKKVSCESAPCPPNEELKN